MSLEQYIEAWNAADYAVDRNELKLEFLNSLTLFHKVNCKEYDSIVTHLGLKLSSRNALENLPFLPVGLFKFLELRSIPLSKISKTMNSSGTSGQMPSRIYLDRENSINQSKALARTVIERIGLNRAPLLIIDSPNVIEDKSNFTARGAGILGFSMFGRPVQFALNPDMSLNMDVLTKFANDCGDEPSLLYGFTSIIWEHFISELISQKARIELPNSILIHGGGWKKLIDLQVSNEIFKEKIESVTQINRSLNYYGMVEQTGSIFMECEKGFLHTTGYNDILIRSPHDFSIAKVGEQGLIQVFSVLPTSYPGHSLITEDLGRILGEEDCICGRIGKYFKVDGRMKSAEIRGCSDTYSSQFS